MVADYDRIAATPNEVYRFAEKLRCKLCGSEMEVGEECYPGNRSDTDIVKWRMTFISCSQVRHYSIDVQWDDPKRIGVIREEVVLDIGESTFIIVMDEMDVEGKTELHIDGREAIKVPMGWFDFDHIDADEFERQINAILLLK
jgi:hypothetical protein